MNHSEQLFQRARNVIPGGVNSPVRAFLAVHGDPPFIQSASGATLTDADNSTYVDYVGSWGPAILGHAHPHILEAVQQAASGGLSYGAPTEREVLLAEEICRRIPNAQMVRLVNSGTEAVMSAVRLARGYTGKDKIIKFDGCYHGHSDGLLVQAGSGVATMGIPGSSGVPASATSDTIIAKYNSLESVRDALRLAAGNLAAILVEPVAGNMGLVPPAGAFLEGLRQICDDEGCLLIFDEVMTGFRIARGGAQQLFSVRADIVTLGKILGGGLPLGAYAASRDIMSWVAPDGPVYQAGTLSGNPLATAAGLAQLELLTDDVYLHLENLGSQLENELNDLNAGIVQRVGSMLTLFFGIQQAEDFEQARQADTDLFAVFHQEMLKRGFYLPPSQFECWFISSAHTEEMIHKTALAARNAILATRGQS